MWILGIEPPKNLSSYVIIWFSAQLWFFISIVKFLFHWEAKWVLNYTMEDRAPPSPKYSPADPKIELVTFKFNQRLCLLTDISVLMHMFFSLNCQCCHLGLCFGMACNWSVCVCILWADTQLTTVCNLCACSSCWRNSSQLWRYVSLECISGSRIQDIIPCGRTTEFLCCMINNPFLYHKYCYYYFPFFPIYLYSYGCSIDGWNQSIHVI